VSDIARAPAGRTAAIALTFISALAALNFIDRLVLAAFLPAIKREFSLTDTRAGMLAASFAFLYALAAVPLGRLADTYPRRVIISVTAALWSVATAACGLANSYASLVAGRIAVALGEAGYLPASFSMISDLFAPARRNFALGVLGAAAAGGGALGILLGGALAGAYGWRAAFLIVGIPGLVIALLAGRFVREPERGATDSRELPREDEPSLARALGALADNRVFRWILLTSACNAYCHLGIVQWLPSYFARTQQLSLATIGAAFGAAFGLGLGLGGFIGGVLATRLARRHVFDALWLCMVTNLLLVPGFLVVLWSPDARVALAASLASMFLGTLGQAALSAGAQNAVAPRLRGLAQGLLMIGASTVGMGAGPLLVGFLSDAFAAAGPARGLRYSLSASLGIFVLAGAAGWRAYRAGKGRGIRGTLIPASAV
jgi:MFS transporter, Spinster family, sphingosine-1-phosphate transporter